MSRREGKKFAGSVSEKIVSGFSWLGRGILKRMAADDLISVPGVVVEDGCASFGSEEVWKRWVGGRGSEGDIG